MGLQDLAHLHCATKTSSEEQLLTSLLHIYVRPPLGFLQVGGVIRQTLLDMGAS
jgi:hypothetical protein